VVGAQAKAEVELREVEGHEIDEGRGLDRIEGRNPALLVLDDLRGHQVRPQRGHEDPRVALRRIPAADRHAALHPAVQAHLEVDRNQQPIEGGRAHPRRNRTARRLRGRPYGTRGQARRRKVRVPVEEVAHQHGDHLALPHVIPQQVDDALLGSPVAFDRVPQEDPAAAERRIGDPGTARGRQRSGRPRGPELAEELLVRFTLPRLDHDPRAICRIEPQPCPAGILEVIGGARPVGCLQAEQVPGPEARVQVDQAGHGRPPAVLEGQARELAELLESTTDFDGSSSRTRRVPRRIRFPASISPRSSRGPKQWIQDEPTRRLEWRPARGGWLSWRSGSLPSGPHRRGRAERGHGGPMHPKPDDSPGFSDAIAHLRNSYCTHRARSDLTCVANRTTLLA
jgi:hypothetical protein